MVKLVNDFIRSQQNQCLCYYMVYSWYISVQQLVCNNKQTLTKVKAKTYWSHALEVDNTKTDNLQWGSTHNNERSSRNDSLNHIKICRTATVSIQFTVWIRFIYQNGFFEENLQFSSVWQKMSYEYEQYFIQSVFWHLSATVLPHIIKNNFSNYVCSLHICHIMTSLWLTLLRFYIPLSTK